jgi:Fur family peroxide stress response transcriptional regulator
MMDKSQTLLRVENVCDQLREQGHRVTSQRLAIIEFIFGCTEHPTVKQIHKALQDRFPTMSLMTVYETLRLLRSMNQVAIASTQSEHTRYDGVRPEPHPHLVCQRCGIIIDANWPHAVDEIPEPEQQGWQIHRWHLEWIGLCPHCQQVANRSNASEEGG